MDFIGARRFCRACNLELTPVSDSSPESVKFCPDFAQLRP